MQGNRIIKPANKQSGFSLVELMIAIAIGLVITAAVTAMAVNSLKMNSATLKSARLNQDLGAVMQIMVNEIRRAGYSYCDKAAYDCPEDEDKVELSYITYATGVDVNIRDVDDGEPPDDRDCILYSYNRNGDSLIDDNERNGFKLEGGGIRMRTSCSGADCSTDCSLDTDSWEWITDPGIITITEFEIDSENSKCHNVNENISIRSIIDTTTGTDKPPTKFACNETESQNLDMWWDGGTEVTDWKTAKSITWPLRKYPTVTNETPVVSVGIRHVNISLKGVFNDPFVETGSDYDEYPIKKSLDVSIKVRNDHVYRCTSTYPESCPRCTESYPGSCSS